MKIHQPAVQQTNQDQLVMRKTCSCGKPMGPSGGCAACQRKRLGVQTKLRVNQPGDKYEQEADRVADQVVRMPEPKEKNTAQGKTNTDRAKSGLLVGNSGISIQRQKAPEQANDSGVQIKHRTLNLPQRQQETDLEEGEEKGLLQAKATPGHTPQVTPNVAANIQSLKGGGLPLPPKQRQFFESRMGQDFSGVRIHTDSKAANTAQTIQAKAYTLGNNIVFNAAQYSHDSQEGKKLLAHELTHVVQQNGGASVGGKKAPTPFTMVQQGGGRNISRKNQSFAPEKNGTNAFGQDVTQRHRPVKINHRAEIGIARSVDDWINTSRNIAAVARLMPYSQLTSDIDEISEWLNRQMTSTIESAQLEEVLKGLILEERRQREMALDKRRRRRRRRRAKNKKDSASDLPQPRILRERTSVQYESPEEVNQEVDLIMAWLARKNIKANERAILKEELNTLAPQFRQGLEQAKAVRHSARVQRAFMPSEDSEFTPLYQLEQTLKGLHSIPEETLKGLYPIPGVSKDERVFLTFHEGEQIPISEKQVNKLKNDVALEFRRGVSRTKIKIDSGFNRYSAQAEINRESPIISFIAGALGDVDNPIKAMNRRAKKARENLALLKEALAAGKYHAAGVYLAQAERLANEIEAAGTAFSEGLIEGAGVAVEGLTITRNVSFAVAVSLGAVVAAPLVAGGIATGAGASGIGLTGAALTTTTVVGTGAVVTGGGALAGGALRGGSNLAGQAFAADSIGEVVSGEFLDTDELINEGLTGAKRGAVDAFTTVTTGGLTKVVGQGASVTGRIVKGGIVGGGGGAAGSSFEAALEGKSAKEIIKAGGRGGLSGGIGGGIGGFVGPALSGRSDVVKVAVGSSSGAAGAGLGTLATGGSLEDAKKAAFIGGITGGVISLAKPQPTNAPKADLRQRQRAAALRREADKLQRKASQEFLKADNVKKTKPERAKRLNASGQNFQKKANDKIMEADEFSSGRRSAVEDIPGPEDFPDRIEDIRSEGGVSIELGKTPPELNLPITKTKVGRRVVYRVEDPNVNRELVDIGPNGDVKIKRGSDIDLNFGSLERARAFQRQKPGTEIKAFEVDEQWFESLQSAATPEKGVGRNSIRDLNTGEPTKIKPLRGRTPQTVDVTKAPDQLKIHSDLIPELQDFIVPGTGKVLDD